MLQPGFFVIGGTLPRDAASYIRREADERLYLSLRRSEICYALTPRQMGKSSLMVQTASRLRRHNISVALLDLTAFGQNLSPDQWYFGLIGRIGGQLNLEVELEQFWNDHLHLGPFQRFAAAIRDVVLRLNSNPVVVFIDEIDAVRSLPFSTDEFFAGIREFFNRRTLDPELNRLTFCLLGVATPSDLIRDTRTTPFTIGTRVELSDLSLEEAAPLAQGLFTDPKKGKQVIQRVLYWTGGHPYLTQRLCEAVSRTATPADVDRACNELFLSHRARERDDNLLFVRERMLRNEADLSGLLLLYRRVCDGANVRDDETNPLVTILRLAGIVRVERGSLRVRNRIYSSVFNKEWVTENLPGAEIRRQRVAYFRGFRIAGIIFAFAIALAGIYSLQKLYSFDTTPPVFRRVLNPPVFWASFTNSTLPTSEGGALLIKASDSDISVIVNGAQYGRTDKGGVLQIPILPPGDYEIRLEKPGFQALSQSARVLTKQETHLSFKLSPLSQVSIENLLFVSQAPPDTRVSVDGKAAGTTSTLGELSVKIQPGEHQIALEKSGYLPRTFNMRLNPGNNAVDGRLDIDAELGAYQAASQPGNLEKLSEFLRSYPAGRFTSQARAQAEELEWRQSMDSNDPNLLQSFIDRYPNGQHINDARHLADQFAAEDTDWKSAVANNTIDSWQRFIGKYPHSRHVADAQNVINLLNDRAGIVQVLRAYQDSYNHHDTKQIVELWPDSRPFLPSLFKDNQSGTITLSPKGEPAVKGELATLTVVITRHSETGDSSKSVPFQFRKQNDHWLIKNGSF